MEVMNEFQYLCGLKIEIFVIVESVDDIMQLLGQVPILVQATYFALIINI